jgi:hypothetical protein
MAICFICGNEKFTETCFSCEKLLPESLIKACGDPFDYVLGLRNGIVIRFTEATVRGDWVNLKVENHSIRNPDLTESAFTFDRHIDVRIADIVWCADAPMGS